MGGKNILIVTPYDPSYSAGGVNTMIRMFSNCLITDYKSNVNILVSDWDKKSIERSTSNYGEIYYRRMRVPYENRNILKSILGWLKEFIPTLLELHNLLKELKIDIIHLHYASSFQFYFRILKWLGGPNYIITFHRGDVVNFHTHNKVDQYLIRWMLKGASSHIAVSSWLKGEVNKVFSEINQVHSILNGIEAIEYESINIDKLTPSLKKELPQQFFLMVSNVTYYKAQDVAIKAWADVCHLQPDLHLVIVGEPRELWDECIHLIKDLGLHQRVHMLGAQSHDDVLRLMKLAEGFLFPSRSEGLPYALLEAGMMKLTTICSDITPFLEVVKDRKNALVVGTEDAKSLANAVLIISADSKLKTQLGTQLNKTVTENFSVKAMTEKYYNIFDSIS